MIELNSSLVYISRFFLIHCACTEFFRIRTIGFFTMLIILYFPTIL